jgi:preprotein translocase subunit YajC
MLDLLAQVVTSAPTSQPVPEAPFLVRLFQQGGLLVPLAILLPFFYFTTMRNKKKQENERQSLLNNLKKGDAIETIGGLIGTVFSTNEEEKTVTIKVDETANVKMKFNRRAIHRVITEDTKK